VAPKQSTARDYAPRDVQLVRSACLTLATYLGDFLGDLVVVGGLVPTLLIPPAQLSQGREAHVGTRDLDLGLGLGILDDERYGELVAHLLAAHFHQDATSRGTPANHRWKHRDENVTVDFLIGPSGVPGANPNVRAIDDNLSAVLADGLPLAFRDRQEVELTGTTLRGEEAARKVWVSGAGRSWP